MSHNVRPSFYRQQTQTWKLNSFPKATSSENKLPELHRGKPGDGDLSEGHRRFHLTPPARAEHANFGWEWRPHGDSRHHADSNSVGPRGGQFLNDGGAPDLWNTLFKGQAQGPRQGNSLSSFPNFLDSPSSHTSEQQVSKCTTSIAWTQKTFEKEELDWL